MLRAFCPLQAAARRYHNMRVYHPPWVELCIPMSGRTRLQKMNKGKATARLSSSSPHQKISQPNITFHRNLGFLEDGGRLLRASVMPSGSFGATKGKVSQERTSITSAFPCGSPGGNRLARRGPVPSSGPQARGAGPCFLAPLRGCPRVHPGPREVRARARPVSTAALVIGPSVCRKPKLSTDRNRARRYRP
jgi:hypothetical protein